MSVSNIDVLDATGVSRNVLAPNSNGQALMAASRPVVIASDQSAVPISGTITANATQSGTWNITNISGAISLPTGAATATNQTTLNTNVGSSADGILTTGVAGSIASYMRTIMETGLGTGASAMNLTQVGSVTIATGNGIAGTGVQRVTVASDNSPVPVNPIAMPANQTTGDTGAKTATGNGATQTNPGYKGVQIILNLGAVSGTSPTLVLSVQGSVDGGTTWYNVPNAFTASLVATGVFGITIYAALAGVGGTTTSGTTTTTSQPVPPTWRVVWTIGGTTPSFTITNIQYNYLIS